MLSKKGIPMRFGDEISPQEDFLLFHHIIADRGSLYSVAIGHVKDRSSLKRFLHRVRNYNKHYQKATHHSFAARIAKEAAIFEVKGDDGETGAGMLLLRVLQRENIINGALCVTRWFGGVKLHGDRFKHLQDAALYAISKVKESVKKG